MVRLTADVSGEKVISRRLERFADAAEDCSPAFVQIRARFVAAMVLQFSSSGQYGSGGWAPLSESYAAWKARAFPGQPILVASGGLRASLTSSLDVDEVGARQARFGSRVKHGRYHQTGTSRMPARPPVALPEGFRRDAVRILQAHILAAGTAAARRDARRPGPLR